jgi:plasmid stabilization system protein ParE
VPQRYRVIISRRAIKDLADIHAYIKKDSPQNAMTVAARLLLEIDSLEYFPQRYAVYRGSRRLSEEVRRMPSYPFLIYYRVEEAPSSVEIVTVRHGKRLPPGDF